MLTVRHIATKTIPATTQEPERIVPDLDADDHERVLWSVEVPAAVESLGGDAIDAYVATQRAQQDTPSEPAGETATEESDHG